MIERAEIARMVPHAGAMCLLDSVVAWDGMRIVCHSDRHHATDNPLRVRDRLSAIHAIEFAAQAMAVHRCLTAEDGARPAYGMLVSVRQCAFSTDRLDAQGSPLVIEATRIASTSDAFTYGFVVGASGAPIARGRASILLVRGDAG
jgi:predicted hotdog family 3-hydroxylacyl-ACP dehydratase